MPAASPTLCIEDTPSGWRLATTENATRAPSPGCWRAGCLRGAGPVASLSVLGGHRCLSQGGIVKLRYSAGIGLAAAMFVTGGASSSSASSPAPGRVESTVLGHNCQTLTLVSATAVSGYTLPSVCVVRDSVGKRFYLFSGVFRFVAGRPVQAQFGVSNGLPLRGTTLLPVAGYQGTSRSDTYYGYGVIEPGGQIRIEGTRPGQTYTVSVSGQIPVAVPAGR